MSVSYVEAVMTLASCRLTETAQVRTFKDVPKDEFAMYCMQIIKEDGYFKDPDDK